MARQFNYETIDAPIQVLVQVLHNPFDDDDACNNYSCPGGQ